MELNSELVLLAQVFTYSEISATTSIQTGVKALSASFQKQCLWVRTLRTVFIGTTSYQRNGSTNEIQLLPCAGGAGRSFRNAQI